jgi:hypothetical protein
MVNTLDPIYIAQKIIVAQQRYLEAYQKGEPPPDWAQNDLATYMPVWEDLVR